MEAADDTLSWKDRCNRYFTSITDADDRADDRSVNEDKDGWTENCDHDNVKHRNADTCNDLSHRHFQCNDLSAIRRRFHGNALTRYVRRTLAVLDIHGAKFASKAGNVAELVVWLLIIIGAITGLVILMYMHISIHVDDVRYDVTGITTLPQIYDQPSVTLCNLNMLKKSTVSGTRFQIIVDIDNNHNNNNNTRTGSTEYSSLGDMISANGRLANFIRESGASLSGVISALNNDVELQIANSAESPATRVKAMETPDMLKVYVQPRKAELELHGHGKEDMVVQCWVGGRKCRSSELTDYQDTLWGKCVRAGVTDALQETLRLLLDVESSEYISALTPTVGISVSVRGPDAGIGGVVAAVAVPGSKVNVETQEVRVTERAGGDCRTDSGYSRQGCLAECLDATVRDVCGCSQIGVTDVSRCDNDAPAQYVCQKAVQHMENTGHIACTCPQTCRDLDYMTTASTSPLTEPAIERIRTWMAAKGTYRNVTDLRTNLVEVSVNMKPWKQIVYKETTEKTILPLLAQIGGLSALVAGVSILTVIELLWMAVRAVWHGVANYRRRSTGTGGVHRLTDSEITSITWAMFRQRRTEEERVKARDVKGKRKKDRKENYIFTGNVQSRLSLHNSHRQPDTEHTYENNNNKYIAHDGHDVGHGPRRDNPDTPHDGHNHMFHRAGNLRSHSTDLAGRRASYHGHKETVYNKPLGNIDNGFKRVSKNGSMERKHSASGVRYVDHNVSMISRNIQQEEIGRPANSMLLVDMSPQYPPAGMYTDRGRIVMPADPLQQYGGPSSAHFHANMVSEPMYL